MNSLFDDINLNVRFKEDSLSIPMNFSQVYTEIETTQSGGASYDDVIRRLSAIESKESSWDAKQDSILDLQSIRSGAAAGATALQSYTETDPTVPNWAKATNKPTYTASEVGALPSTTVIPTKVSNLDNDVGYLTSHQDISGKVDKVIGKELSTNDYDNTAKAKVDAIPENPKYTDTIVSKTSELENDSGFIDDTYHDSTKSDTTHKHDDLYQEKGSYATANHNHSGVYQPIGNYANVNHDHDGVYLKSFTETDPTVPSFVKSITEEDIARWNEGSQCGAPAWDSITGKPTTFPPSSHTHSFNNLDDKPVIPTKISELTNDSGFITNSIQGMLDVNLGNTDNLCVSIHGSGANQGFVLSRDSGAQCVLEAGNSVGLFGTKNNKNLQIRTNYINRMTFDTSGGVTLATDVPSNSNSNQIATTKWVTDYHDNTKSDISHNHDDVYLKEHQDISGKQNVIDDLESIRSGAAAGATALQSYTEIDPTVPDWAKQESKPTYTASEVGAAEYNHTHSFESITSKPSTYPPSAHSHTYASITDKPESFSPSAHEHSVTDITDFPTIPAEVTESIVSGWGFTKNTGTYSKPSTGIPPSDLEQSYSLTNHAHSEYLTEDSLSDYAKIDDIPTSGYMVQIVYNTTKASEIQAILDAGNTPYILYNGNTYYYQDISYDNYYRFVSITPGSTNTSDPPIVKRIYKSKGSDTGGWGTGTIQLYSTNHKPTASDCKITDSEGHFDATTVEGALQEIAQNKIDTPLTGTAGQFLKKTASGVEWASIPDDDYINNLIDTKLANSDATGVSF